MDNKPSTMVHEDFHYGDEENAHYLKEGYHICDKFLTDEALAYCRAKIDPMTEKVGDERKKKRRGEENKEGSQTPDDP